MVRTARTATVQTARTAPTARAATRLRAAPPVFGCCSSIRWRAGTGSETGSWGKCIDFARAVGYRELVLWTNDVLAAARRIYLRAGFELVAEEQHRSSGLELTGQDWRLTL